MVVKSKKKVSENISEQDIEISDQKKVTKITIIHVVLLFTIKTITSFFSNSLSFLSELADSILDFVALFITYMGLKQGRKKPDFKHMFGHYKINSAAGFIQSTVTICLYCYILATALQTIYQILRYKISYQTQNSLIQVIVLVLILGVVFIDSYIIIRIGKKQKNTLIIAQGENFRGDFYRNVSFIIGLIIVSLGYSIIDLIFASIFSVRSIIIGIKLLRKSYDELVDSNSIKQDELEKIEDEINALSGLKRIQYLAIRTHGNHLDCRITVQIDSRYSVFSGNIIADQIRSVINQKFGYEFQCNVFVQFNLENSPAKLQNLDTIFDVIHHLGVSDQNIHNIHNITIDEYHDHIVVQYHIDLDPEMQLAIGHKIATELEDHIKDIIRNKLDGGMPITIISHLEPITLEKKIHSHPINRPLDPLLTTQISDIIRKDPRVKSIKDLQIQNESDGIYVIATALLDPNLTIKSTHKIIDNIEYLMMDEIPELKKCLIHSEPSISVE